MTEAADTLITIGALFLVGLLTVIVILSGSVAFIGETQRTNRNGIEQLSKILNDMNYEVRTVKLPDTYLHLDQVIGVNWIVSGNQMDMGGELR